jgi:hypothetical protein
VNDSQSKAIEEGVVQLIQTSISLLLIVELKISISERLASSPVDYDFSTLQFIALRGDELVEIKIEEALLREV